MCGAGTAYHSWLFSGVCVPPSLVCCVVFCRSLFVILFFFVWPLYFLSFFDLQLLITPLVSSNFLLISQVYCNRLLEKLENTKGVIRSHNGKDRLTTEIEKDKRTNTDGQNTIQLTKIYFNLLYVISHKDNVA